MRPYSQQSQITGWMRMSVLLITILCLFRCGPAREDSREGEIAVADALAAVSIADAPNGVVAIPETVPAVIRDVFVKYARIQAPNGKPIHLLAQAGWTEVQIVKARNVLTHLLTDFPGSAYGNDKAAVADAMADRNAAMVLFNTVEDLEKAFTGPLRHVDLHMQDLRANENPAEGTYDYMHHITRDASFEEIWHLVHDHGIKITQPEMLAEMRRANDAAAAKGWRAWPEDEPDEHPNEYVGVLLDNYYDLWTVKPKKYEGRDILPEDLPDGMTHFGRYFANSRARLRELDPAGLKLVEKFFHPYLTYVPRLPADFEGAFSLAFDPELVYTAKSRWLKDVTLSGRNAAGLIGNDLDNVLTGNQGDNALTGGAGDDTLDGRGGADTAVFSGAREEYSILLKEDEVKVIDGVSGRDGTDTLTRVEFIRFADETVKIEAERAKRHP